MEKYWIFVAAHIALAKYCTTAIFDAIQLKVPTHSIVFIIFSTFFFIILISILLPLLIICYIYKNMVSLILYLKVGSNFINLITGCNMTSTFSETNGFVISTITYIESDRTGQDLFKEIREEIWKHFKNPMADRKIFSVRKQFMGYLYFEEMKVVEKSKLFEYVQLNASADINDVLKYYGIEKSLPYKGMFNWDVTLLSVPELCENGKKKYILIFRMNHFLVDGLTLFNITKFLSLPSDKLENYGKTMTEKLKAAKGKNKISTTIRNLSAYTSPIKISDSPPTNSKPHISFYLENTPSAIPKLKQIKEIFPETSFHVLIYTAYSASLANYFIHNTPNKIPIPESLNIVHPFQLNMEKFSSYISSPAKLDNLNNDFSFFNWYVPIVPKHKIGIPIEDYMIERLKICQEEFSKVMNSIDVMLNNVLTKTYFEVFPINMVQLIMKYSQYNVLGTVFPGGPKRFLFNGDKIIDSLFLMQLIPKRTNCVLYGLTYDDRFHFAHLADPGKFESKEEFHKIFPNFFKYLDILYEECLKYRKSF